MTDKTDLTQFEGHTAGPWEVGAPQNKIITAYRDENGNMTKENITGNGWGKVIANVAWPVWKTVTAWDADARLIAAAPTLLSELKAERAENTALKAEVERWKRVAVCEHNWKDYADTSKSGASLEIASLCIKCGLDIKDEEMSLAALKGETHDGA